MDFTAFRGDESSVSGVFLSLLLKNNLSSEDVFRNASLWSMTFWLLLQNRWRLDHSFCQIEAIDHKDAGEDGIRRNEHDEYSLFNHDSAHQIPILLKAGACLLMPILFSTMTVLTRCPYC